METTTTEFPLTKPFDTKNFPEPNFFIDPSNQIDTDVIIDATLKDPEFFDQSFLKVFDELKSNRSHLRHHDNGHKLIGFLVEKFTLHYLKETILSSTSYTAIHLGWARVGADIESRDAAYQLMSYALKNHLDSTFITHWAKAAFNLLCQYINDNHLPSEIDEGMTKMYTIIDEVLVSEPKLALHFAGQLIRISQENRLLNDYTKRSKETFNSMSKQYSGVIVLGEIEPAADRVVRTNCERYQPLVNTPIDLISINNVDTLQQSLDQEFPWFSDITSRISQSLRLRCLGGTRGFFIPPMLLLGSPGIGKTSYLNRLAVLSGVPFKVISMSGKNDNRDLVGTSRGWGSGHPGMPISFINEHQIANPIIQLDEIDKCGGSDHNGRALDSLLTFFESSTSQSIYDEYLCTTCDYSHITWISSANSIQHLPSTLISRLDVINVAPPQQKHYPRIIESSIKSFCSSNGIHPAHIPEISDTDWKWLSKHFKSPRIAKKAAEKWLAYKLLTPEQNNLN